MEVKNNSPYDSAWKDIIEDLWEDFLRFFFPEVWELIDFTRGREFLDKELQKIIKIGEVGKRYADKLVKVWPKIDNGPGDPEDSRALGYPGSPRSLQDLLLHIEVQGYREKNFAQRIFIYHYKIFERYKKPVLNMVILADPGPTFRPKKYVDKRFGYGIELEWKLIKLIDYRGREAELTQSTEPFALVVLAFLEYSKTKGNTRKKYAAKKKLIELVIDKDLGERRSQSLLRFIDWTLQLPEEWEKRLEEDIQKKRGGKPMPYVTSWERRAAKIAREEGEKEGEKEGKKYAAKKMLEKGFGIDLVREITDLSENVIKELKNNGDTVEEENE